MKLLKWDFGLHASVQKERVYPTVFLALFDIPPKCRGYRFVSNRGARIRAKKE